jgi:isocitrate/isopropylmalate dehydrogenase
MCTGEILPDSALEELKKLDSVFLGAIDHPDVKPGILEVGILLPTRFALDRYIYSEAVSMFDPTGGSAPKYTGKNVINPLATISAGCMMIDTLGEPAVAVAVDKATHDALASGKIKSLTAGKMGMGTRAVGDLIAKLVS